MDRLLVAATVTLVSAGSLAAEDVSFRLAQAHAVIVPVLVNGHGPYDFLLDTGSTTTVVDRELAKELGLEALGASRVRTTTGTERVPIARVDRISLGSSSARTVLVVCSRLQGIRSLDRSIRGVLGFNFLSRFQYLLDYVGKRLVLEPSPPVGGVRLPFDASQHSVALTVSGLRLLLDTGANGLFLFDFGELEIEVSPRAPRCVSTNDGRRIARSGWIRRLDIGGEPFDRVPVTLIPRTGLEDRADGLLPGTLFDSIYFDHQRKLIVLNPESSTRDHRLSVESTW